jgi:hypothetical protein
MYRTFQCCRHSLSKSPYLLKRLLETLEIVKQRKKLLIKMPAEWIRQHKLQECVIPLGISLKRGNTLSDTNHKLFALIDTGTHELQNLWQSEAIELVRKLGYAFHNIPGLLWTPEEFNPRFYAYNFRVIGDNWDKLSLEMRQAFCAVQGIELSEVISLLTQPSDGYS